MIAESGGIGSAVQGCSAAADGTKRPLSRSLTPLSHILRETGIRRIDLASVAGLDVKTVHRFCQGHYASLKIGTILRVAVALGVRPCDLVPVLRARLGTRGLASRAKRARSARSRA